MGRSAEVATPGASASSRVKRVLVATIYILCSPVIVLIVLMVLLSGVVAMPFLAARDRRREERCRESLRLTGRMLTPEQAIERIVADGGTLILDQSVNFRRPQLWWTSEAVPPVPRLPPEYCNLPDPVALWDEWIETQAPVCRRYVDLDTGSAMFINADRPLRLAMRLRRRFRELRVVRLESLQTACTEQEPRSDPANQDAPAPPAAPASPPS